MTRCAAVAVFGLALGAVAPAMAGSSCPADSVDGQSLLGTWQGYVLSTAPAGYSTSANMILTITENATSSMFATMNLTAPTCTGKGCPAVKPPTGSCVAHFSLTCLDYEHPDDIGFRLEDPVPECFTTASPWRCDYLLTGNAYQEEGHPVAFYFSARYDPYVSHDPMRFEPFGKFVTGCTAGNVEVDYQARAHGVSGQDPAVGVALA